MAKKKSKAAQERARDAEFVREKRGGVLTEETADNFPRRFTPEEIANQEAVAEGLGAWGIDANLPRFVRDGGLPMTMGRAPIEAPVRAPRMPRIPEPPTPATHPPRREVPSYKPTLGQAPPEPPPALPSGREAPKVSRTGGPNWNNAEWDARWKQQSAKTKAASTEAEGARQAMEKAIEAHRAARQPEVDMSPSATMERALKQGNKGGQGPEGGAGGGSSMPEAEGYGNATSRALRATGPVVQAGEAQPAYIDKNTVDWVEPAAEYQYTYGADRIQAKEDRIKEARQPSLNKGGGGQGGGTGGGGMDMVQEAAPGDEAQGLTADPKSVLQDYAKLNQAYQGNVTSPAIEENGKAIAEVGAKMAALPPTYKFSRDGIPEGMDIASEMARLGALIGKNEASANDIDNYITLQVAEKTKAVRDAGKPYTNADGDPIPTEVDLTAEDNREAPTKAKAARPQPQAAASSGRGSQAAASPRGGGGGGQEPQEPVAKPKETRGLKGSHGVAASDRNSMGLKGSQGVAASDRNSMGMKGSQGVAASDRNSMGMKGSFGVAASDRNSEEVNPNYPGKPKYWAPSAADQFSEFISAGRSGAPSKVQAAQNARGLARGEHGADTDPSNVATQEMVQGNLTPENILAGGATLAALKAPGAGKALKGVGQKLSQAFKVPGIGAKPAAAIAAKVPVVVPPVSTRGPVKVGTGPAAVPRGPAAAPKGPAAQPKGPAAKPKGPAPRPRPSEARYSTQEKSRVPARGPAAKPKGPAATPKGPAAKTRAPRRK